MVPTGRSASSDGTEEGGTRARILAAARDAVVEVGFGGFTVDDVAQRADVSRLTVYYHFGSKPELVEAVLDDFAARGRIGRLADAFREESAEAALASFIAIFCDFWDSDRPAFRRMRGWQRVEGGGPHAERDAWRRKGIKRLVHRLAEECHVPAEGTRGEVEDVLDVLTSFETFDVLAGDERDGPAVAAILVPLARTAIGLP